MKGLEMYEVEGRSDQQRKELLNEPHSRVVGGNSCIVVGDSCITGGKTKWP